jgi:hypothetical protein
MVTGRRFPLSEKNSWHNRCGRPHLPPAPLSAKRCPIVAIHPDLLDVLNVAGGQPFHPQGIAGPAVVGGPAGFQGRFPGLLVHVGQHEHLSGLFVLSNGRYQPPIFSKFSSIIRFHFYSSFQIPLFHVNPNYLTTSPVGVNPFFQLRDNLAKNYLLC